MPAPHSKMPVGESWRVSVDGQFRTYKTRAGAEKRCKELTAQGKVPTISTYCKIETPLLLEENTE